MIINDPFPYKQCTFDNAFKANNFLKNLILMHRFPPQTGPTYQLSLNGNIPADCQTKIRNVKQNQLQYLTLFEIF